MPWIPEDTARNIVFCSNCNRTVRAYKQGLCRSCFEINNSKVVQLPGITSIARNHFWKNKREVVVSTVYLDYTGEYETIVFGTPEEREAKSKTVEEAVKAHNEILAMVNPNLPGFFVCESCRKVTRWTAQSEKYCPTCRKQQAKMPQRGQAKQRQEKPTNPLVKKKQSNTIDVNVQRVVRFDD